MKARDIVTLIGGCCSAAGLVMVDAVHDTTIWWIGKILVGVGPALMGARGLMKEPELPSSQTKTP